MGSFELRLGGGLLALIVLASLVAPWLAPAAPELEFDRVQGGNLEPGTRRLEVELRDGRRWLADSVAPGDGVLDIDRGGRRQRLAAGELLHPERPARKRRFLLGTDHLSRDVLSRLLHGGRLSLVIASAAALLSTLLGLGIGALAAASGRGFDAVLMRATDTFLAFPRLFLLLAVAGLLRPGVAIIVAIFALTSWMSVARIARAELVKLRSTELAVAARASGLSATAVMLRHLVPNALAPILVALVLRIADVMLLETALSFLGIGVEAPTPTWGNMIADASRDLRTGWWNAAFPGLAILATVASIHLLGDGLQERLQPRSH